jgi:hypothetical protein
MSLERASGEVLDWHTLIAARSRVEATPAFAKLVTLFRWHFGEIRDLIHRRRPVTVTWHRSKGPLFVAELIRAAQRPDFVAKAEIDGVTLMTAIVAMRNVLLKEGSPDLCLAITSHWTEICRAADRITQGQATGIVVRKSKPCHR